MRGKTGSPYEFGQKMHLSVVNGFMFVEEQPYGNFNEGTQLQDAAERYRERTGHWLEKRFWPTLSTVIGRTGDSARSTGSACRDLGWVGLGRMKWKKTKHKLGGTAWIEAWWRAEMELPSGAMG